MISENRRKGEHNGTPVSTITIPEENVVRNRIFRFEPTTGSVIAAVRPDPCFLLRQSIAGPIQLLVLCIMILPESPECVFALPAVDRQVGPRGKGLAQQFGPKVIS